MKQKPAKFKGSEQQLKVRIAVNPEVYKIVSNSTFRQGSNIGKLETPANIYRHAVQDLLWYWAKHHDLNDVGVATHE